MNQMMEHFTLHQQCIPFMRLSPGILFHPSYENRLAEIIQADSNRYHQYSNNSFIKTVGNFRIYPPIYQDFIHPLS